MKSGRNGVRGFFRNAGSFVLGSLVGASAALAAHGRRRQRKSFPGGLAASCAALYFLRGMRTSLAT